MKNSLLRLRYYLEIIALPIFLFFVIHLAGHSISGFLGESHIHHHNHEIHTEESDKSSSIHEIFEHVFTVEILSGILLLILFVWIWHRPQFKKWVPCSHTHCHHKPGIPHILATIALCLHFFPEAGVRHELLKHIFEGGIINTLGFIGFIAHFLVDVIIALLISSYWTNRRTQILSFASITIIWIVAFHIGQHIEDFVPHMAEGVLFFISAFLLAMFVHIPHKPTACEKCE